MAYETMYGSLPKMLQQWLPFIAGVSAVGGVSMSMLPAEAVPPAAPPGVMVKRDIPFLTPDRSEKLDLYLPAERPKGARSPGIVIIHGGGWSGGSKSADREFEIGTTLANAGYVCVSIDYELAPSERWPTNIQDCKNAVRFLRKNAATYGVDTEHIGVIGGSAGGHLALMVGLTASVKSLEPRAPYPGIPDRVQAIVDMYGITDVRTGKKTDEEGNPTDTPRSWDAVFGTHEPITDADRALASPVTHLSAKMPPVLILHGTADTTVDRDQSITLDKKLTELRVAHELILVPGIGHTFDLETWSGKPLPADLRPTVIGFFDRYLK
jgi:acetyl esterase/lipase